VRVDRGLRNPTQAKSGLEWGTQHQLVVKVATLQLRRYDILSGGAWILYI